MKKNNAKKLALSKETLRRLTQTDLLQAAGGAWSDESICPATGPSKGGGACPQERDGNPGHH